MPVSFAFYDLNEDNKISLHEFAQASGMDSLDCKDVFDIVDKNSTYAIAWKEMNNVWPKESSVRICLI